MALSSFEYLGNQPDLTPERTNYLDTFDFTTIDIPQLRAEAIKKFDTTIYGFTDKFAGKEMLTSDKYIWSELERTAVTYDDLVYNGTTKKLTRASSAELKFRKHEKVELHTSACAGIFIVISVNTAQTEASIESYDAGAVTLDGNDTTYTAVYGYSLGIEVAKGSEGSDFTAGVRQPYTIRNNRPAITRNVYKELGSIIPQVKWVSINGQKKWFIDEIDLAREHMLEMIEKKLVSGEKPDGSSYASATMGLQGTDGVFEQIRDHGATWQDYVSSETDIKNLIKHWDKVNGAGDNLFLCNRDAEFAFDDLAKQYNASYGGSATLKNYIGEYNNGEQGKILNLGFKGFNYGGYTLLKQGWKYLKENTFLGNSNIAAANKINFVSVPVGKTPVSFGDQSLEFNQSPTQMNYMTILEARPYQSWVEGGAGWMGARTNGDDSFKVHFLNESMIALYNAEKFIIGEGTAS